MAAMQGSGGSTSLTTPSGGAETEVAGLGRWVSEGVGVGGGGGGGEEEKEWEVPPDISVQTDRVQVPDERIRDTQGYKIQDTHTKRIPNQKTRYPGDAM